MMIVKQWVQVTHKWLAHCTALHKLQTLAAECSSTCVQRCMAVKQGSKPPFRYTNWKTLIFTRSVDGVCESQLPQARNYFVSGC